jgi:thermostable hemolysin
MTLQLPMLRTAPPSAVRAVPLRFRIGFAQPGTAEYAFCVDQVRRKYRDRYGAVVDPRPDVFVIARDDTFRSPTFGRPLGMAGLTAAAGRRLLSESYLDVGVEQVCTEFARETDVDRRRIVEMGPFASFYPGAALFLMRRLPGITRTNGHDFLLATLTTELHAVARTAGWHFQTVANARRADLTSVTTDWGTYYTTKPRTGILRCAA